MSLAHFYYDPLTEFDRLFDDALIARFQPSTTRVARATQPHPNPFRPRMDLQESKDSNTLIATFDLPGLNSNDITIDLHQNHLTISGESKSSHALEEEGYAVRERHYGKFARTLQLPFGIKPEDIKAKMENGVLTITFPKTTPDQQAKRIAVQ